MSTLSLKLIEKFEKIGISKDNENKENKLLYFLVDSNENKRLIDPTGNYYLIGECVEKGKLSSDEELEKIFKSLKTSLDEDILKYQGLELSNLHILLFESDEIECLVISSKTPIKKGEFKTTVSVKKIPASFLESSGLSIAIENGEPCFKLEVLIKGHHETFNNINFSSDTITIDTEVDGELDFDDIQLQSQASLNQLFKKQEESPNSMFKNFSLYEFIKLDKENLYKQGNIRIYTENNNIMIETIYNKENDGIVSMY